ncbi:MAG TPA: tyrosine-type recombinase/integrase [Acidimicrobiales bacterium]|nr:tyrosine-type recombinase/integrase [Acidimicrobiales bacterium]
MRGHLRKRGRAWELRAYAGIDPLTNRQKYVTRTFRGGKREAEEALARFVTEVSGGGHAAQDTTVGDLIRQWLDLAKPELSPTTARGYEWIITTYVTPTLGKVPLAKLRTAQLDRFYGQLREKGGQDGKALSAATVRQVHAIVRRALQQGVRWGWIATNPASLASPPRVRSRELAPPEPAEVVTLIQAAESADPDLGCFLHLAATTGARRGELCGLRWKDVDLDAGTLTISRSVVEAAHSVLVEKDTKTHASRRLALDPDTVDSLRRHRKRVDERVGACDAELSENAYVFSAEPDGTRPWAPNDVTKDFIRLRNRAGLTTVRLHDLRHFAATRLLAAGVPVRTVSGRLGHSNAAMTLDVYAHFVEESDREAAATLGALLQDKNGSRRDRSGECSR